MSKDHDIKQIPGSKQPLGIPRLLWEDCIKHDVKKLDPGLQRRISVLIDREKSRDICLTVCGLNVNATRKLKQI